MYCPIHGNGIGVLVADNPYGPYKDPLGQPLVWQKEHWDDIDPTVWIDDDGQAYMYWGNPNVYYVKLNEDMISYSGDKFTEFTTSLKDAKGTHDLYFVFVGNAMQRKNLFNFDWWEVK